VLGSVFSLTLFTIAVSIVRGVVQNVQGRSGSKPPNPTWNLFWGAIELFTGKSAPPRVLFLPET